MHTCTRILSLGLLGLAVACGSDPAPETAFEPLEMSETPDPELEEEAKAQTASNSRPEIRRLGFDPEEPAVGDTVRAVVETSDADDDRLWLEYEWTLDGKALDVDADRLELSPNQFKRGDHIAVSVVASDGKMDVNERHSEMLANAVPKLLTVEVVPSSDFHSGAPITLRPDARDTDGDEISFRYEWKVNGRSVREEGPVLETKKLRRGDEVQAWVVVADSDDESEPFETPVFTIANSPPQVVSRPSGPSSDGTFRYQVEATDLDGDRNLQYHLENEPQGMTIDHLGGSIVWAPNPDQTGKHQVSVIVDDLRGGQTRHLIEVNVGEPGAGQPPAAGAR